MVRGYRLPAEVASSNAIEDLFAASGTAMTLMPESRDVNDLLGIAQAILRHCPAKMEVRHPVEMLRTKAELKFSLIGNGVIAWFVGRNGLLLDTVTTSFQSPGEIKRREVELGSLSWMDCLAAELFLSSCSSDTVFVT